MRISVIMAAYNARIYVAEAIESVLKQSRPPDEFIVIDDGSTDGTGEVIERYRDRIVSLSQPNSGQTVALNRGIAVATGNVLGFHDADDIWCEPKLELQVAALQADETIDAVFGLVRQFVSPDVPEPRRAALMPANEILRGECKPAMLIRRAAYERFGLLDETFRATGMIEWLGRAKLQGLRSLMLDEIMVWRRLHLGNGRHANPKAQDDDTLLALKRVIDARRARC